MKVNELIKLLELVDGETHVLLQIDGQGTWVPISVHYGKDATHLPKVLELFKDKIIFIKGVQDG